METLPLTFTVTAAERQKVRQWIQDHACGARPGTAGDLLAYQFTPTGLGDVVCVLCPCGAKLVLTDFESW